VDKLDNFVGRIIDLDGTPYRLVGLDGFEAVLSDPFHKNANPAGDIRMPRDYVAEAMIQLVLRPAADYRQ
jgi:hypothetical protein